MAVRWRQGLLHSLYAAEDGVNVTLKVLLLKINMIGGTERHLPTQRGSRRQARREFAGNGGEAFS